MSQIKIGWASRDVSTTEPINIPGQFHVRISTGVLDPVTITALVLDDGDDSTIFLSCDVVAIRSYLVDSIRSKVAKIDPEIPAHKLLMNATHTHTGPSHFFDGQLRPDDQSAYERNPSVPSVLSSLPDYGIKIASSDKYREFLSTQAAEAIAEAWHTRKEGGVSWGYGYAVVAHSRRVVYFDDVSKRPGAVNRPGLTVNGHAVMYGNTNDDKFEGYEAGADHFVNLLYTFDADGKLTGAIVNVPCPSQCSEGMTQLSASYWHEAREAIRAKHGNIFILPQCAAGGDLAPRILHYKKAQERRFRLKYGRERAFSEEFERLDIGERIANAFTEVLDWAKKDIRTDLPVRHEVTTLNLPRRLITKEEYEAQKIVSAEVNAESFATEGTLEERMNHDSILLARRNRCNSIIKRYESQEKNPTIPMEMHVIRVGDIAFASNRFELYMDYMHRMQARSPFEQTFIVQLAGMPGPDGGSYLCTERGAANRGYSASLYCNQASPAAGQMIVEETLRILKTMQD